MQLPHENGFLFLSLSYAFCFLWVQLSAITHHADHWHFLNVNAVVVFMFAVWSSCIYTLQLPESTCNSMFLYILYVKKKNKWKEKNKPTKTLTHSMRHLYYCLRYKFIDCFAMQMAFITTLFNGLFNSLFFIISTVIYKCKSNLMRLWYLFWKHLFFPSLSHLFR